MKEILKIQCNIDILMKKVISLRKIHATMKYAIEKTKHIHASAPDLLYTL